MAGQLSTVGAMEDVLRGVGLTPIAPVDAHGTKSAPDVYCALLIGNESLGCPHPSPGLNRAQITGVARRMAARGAGRMVLVTDVSMDVDGDRDPDTCASLGADRLWWNQLAASYARYGVTANTVVVGHAPFLGHQLDEDTLAYLFRYTVLRRPTAPGDVAACLRVAVASGSSYLVGETLRADGGMDIGVIPAIRTGARTSASGSASRNPLIPQAPEVAIAECDLAGQRVLVTGASSGIGRAAALHLAERGAAVVLASRRVADLDAVAHTVEQFGSRAWTLPCDLTDGVAATSLVQDAWKVADGIDSVLYAAGHLGLPSADPHTDRFQTTFAVNYLSFMSIAEDLVARWKEAGVRGCIAGVASVSSTLSPVPGLEHYGASKAAMIQYTRAAAVTGGRYGIRAGCVAPGIIETPMGRAAGPEHRRGWISRIPAGRVGAPHEVATVLGHLLSPAAASLTGFAPRVDGGFGLLGIASPARMGV